MYNDIINNKKEKYGSSFHSFFLIAWFYTSYIKQVLCITLYISNKSYVYNNKNRLLLRKKEFWVIERLTKFVFVADVGSRLSSCVLICNVLTRKLLILAISFSLQFSSRIQQRPRERTSVGARQWATIYLQTVRKYGTRTISPELNVYQFICQERV